MKTAQEILESNCPSMNPLFLDDAGKAFRLRVIQAMEEYARDQVISLTTEKEDIEEMFLQRGIVLSKLEGDVRNLIDAMNTQAYKIADIEQDNSRLLLERKTIIEENASMAVLNLSYQCKISRLYNLLIENKIEIPQ